MRLTRTSDIPERAILGRDVLTGRDAAPLLRAGATIEPRYRDALARAGIPAVYIEDPVSEGIVPENALSHGTRLIATRALTAVHEDARRAIRDERPLSNAAAAAASDIVERILVEVKQLREPGAVLADLCSPDAYAIQHSIDATVLGLLIAHRLFSEKGWVDFRGVRQQTDIDDRLYELGMGLLLGDIGKLAIPAEIINKPGALLPSEWEIVRTHPRAGIDVLRDSSAWCPLVQTTVLRHHERWDGSGYPSGKHGEEIPEAARIAAVADVYDAITSERLYAPARPAHEAVRLLRSEAGTLFDPTVVGVFARLAAPFPPGIEVELTDGRRALVVSVSEEAHARPVVRVIDGPGAPFDVSLAEDRSLGIAGWHRDGDTLAAVA
jgi:HD-GYP domain-containing protein (c-di-GMP phosphodiesterase class II)